METFRYRIWPLCVLFLTGCTDCSDRERRDLNRRRDALVQQRIILGVEQASIQIAIRQDLGGRPPETLSQAEADAVRASPRGQQLDFVTWRLQVIDREIESIQDRLWDLENPRTP